MADNRDDEGFGTTARGDGAQHRRDALSYLGGAEITQTWVDEAADVPEKSWRQIGGIVPTPGMALIPLKPPDPALKAMVDAFYGAALFGRGMCQVTHQAVIPGSLAIDGGKPENPQWPTTRREHALMGRIRALEAELAAEKANHDEVTDKWEAKARIAQLETEVEALRVERDEARSRLVSAAETIRKLATGEPAMWSDGNKLHVRGVYPPIEDGAVRTVIGMDFGTKPAMVVTTIRDGQITDVRDMPEAATHAKPFPAKAMR
jgi:hypothetical protein